MLHAMDLPLKITIRKTNKSKSTALPAGIFLHLCMYHKGMKEEKESKISVHQNFKSNIPLHVWPLHTSWSNFWGPHQWHHTLDQVQWDLGGFPDVSHLRIQREGEGDWRSICFAPTAVHVCVCVCREGDVNAGGYLHRAQQGVFPPQEVLFPPTKFTES